MSELNRQIILRIWFLPIVKRERIFQSTDYFIRPPSRDYLISSQVFLYFLNKGQERFLENQRIRLRAYIRRLCQRSSCLSASMEFAYMVPPHCQERVYGSSPLSREREFFKQTIISYVLLQEITLLVLKFFCTF